MATLGRSSPPSGSPSHGRKTKTCVRKCERCICSTVIYFPLLFVYGLTTWAVWIQIDIGLKTTDDAWTGYGSMLLALFLYVLLNWSYTTAVFTDPGSPVRTEHAYSVLPSHEPPSQNQSLTVKSTGEMRYCKKCQTRKPDRAHHCSTCRRCVLKMDHHCPWLATCVGFRNYKPFLLFLIYTTIFCWVAFAASGSWVWSEVLTEEQYRKKLMPVNYILLAVLGGIIGLVLGGFTLWHVYLACRGQTTIESLEKTRYLSPLRRSAQQHFQARNYVGEEGNGLADQLREIHANALPGITRPEEGEERTSPAQSALQRNYHEMERRREQQRYDSYLDELDSEKLPNAFNLGWKRNLGHVFGEKPLLWLLPICNTTGDGWQWETSREWIEAKERLAKEREAQFREDRAFESEGAWSRGPIVDFRSDRPRGYEDNVRAVHPQSSQFSMRTLDSRPSTQRESSESSSDSHEEADYRTGTSHNKDTSSNWNDIPDDLLRGSPRPGMAKNGTKPR